MIDSETAYVSDVTRCSVAVVAKHLYFHKKFLDLS